MAKFCSGWLEALARHVVAAWLFALLSVPSLDACGAEQLAADVAYLLNVFAALGLRRWGGLQTGSRAQRHTRTAAPTRTHRLLLAKRFSFSFRCCINLYRCSRNPHPEVLVLTCARMVQPTRHAVLVHVLNLCKLDKDAFAAALRRPKTAPGQGVGADEALGCAVLRKLERHLAFCRGVAMVFGDDQEEG